MKKNHTIERKLLHKQFPHVLTLREFYEQYFSKVSDLVLDTFRKQLLKGRYPFLLVSRIGNGNIRVRFNKNTVIRHLEDTFYS